MKRKNNFLKEAGVLLIAAILVLTAIVIVPTMMAQPSPHDVGVSKIISPFSGCLTTYPVNVTVKNYEDNAETTDVQVNIFKWDAGPPIMSEDFSTWPPTGWTTDYWKQSLYTNNAGGDPPEAGIEYTDYFYTGAYIMSKTVDASNCCKIILEFNLTGDFSDSYVSCFYVNWTNDGGATWNEITPWTNPITNDLGPKRYSIDIPCGCSGSGNDFQVKWEFIGSYYCLQYGSGIYLDDVKIVKTCVDGEYAEIVEDVTIDPGEEVFVNFPDWMPSGCGEYCVTAFTLLENDENPDNDCKTVDITVSCDFTLEDIINMINELKEYVISIDLGHGTEEPLINQLNVAIHKIEENKIRQAIDKLNGFIDLVEVKRSNGDIPNDEAAILTATAEQIIWLLENCI